MFAEKSTLSPHWCLSKFLFMGIHLSINSFAVFGFEQIHCLFLGAEETPKEWMVLMIDDETSMNASVRCANRNIKPFRFSRWAILSTLKIFLWGCSERSPGYKLNVDCSESEKAESVKIYDAAQWDETAWYARDLQIWCNRHHVIIFGRHCQ